LDILLLGAVVIMEIILDNPVDLVLEDLEIVAVPVDPET
jgi:hypothetical protein